MHDSGFLIKDASCVILEGRNPGGKQHISKRNLFFTEAYFLCKGK